MGQIIRRRKPSAVEAIGSLSSLIAVLGAVVALDDRVRGQFTLDMSRGGLASWGERAGAAARMALNVARDQTSGHEPLLVFSVVAVLLLLFMLRT